VNAADIASTIGSAAAGAFRLKAEATEEAESGRSATTATIATRRGDQFT